MSQPIANYRLLTQMPQALTLALISIGSFPKGVTAVHSSLLLLYRRPMQWQTGSKPVENGGNGSHGVY